MASKLSKIGFMFILYFTLALNSASSFAVSVNHQAIQWESWSDSAFAQAKSQNKNVLISVKAEWCHWCQQMEMTTFVDENVVRDINAKYIPIQVDIDKQTDIIRQYHITNLPAFILLTPSKQVIYQFSGFLTPTNFLNFLKLQSKTEAETSKVVPEIKMHIVIMGNRFDNRAKNLYKTAAKFANVGIESEIIAEGGKSKDDPSIRFPILSKPAAFVCTSYNCSLPLFTTEKLEDMIKRHINLNSTNDNSQIFDTKPLTADNDTSISEKLMLANKFSIMLGFWSFGILLAFTPCVLPLLIIIAGFLGGRTGCITRMKTIYLALTYVFSLAITYSAAGVISALFGFYIQAYLQSTWILVAFSTLFVLLALSLLGVYQIRLPSSLRHKLIQHVRIRESYSFVQVAIMGILATLIASPCAAAPLLAVLGYVGETGNILIASIALFCLGLGVGTPLLIAVSIGSSILPKKKSIQEAIKVFFGLVLLGVAIWLLYNVIPQVWSMVLWSGLVIYAAVWMKGADKNENNHIWKLWDVLNVMVFIYGIAIFFGALFGNTNPLKPLEFHAFPYVESAYYSQVKEINSMAEFNQYVLQAKNENKPILLAFFATWCEACKKVESFYSDPSIQESLKKFIVLRVNFSNINNMKLAKKFNIIAPPAILFFDSRGIQLPSLTEGNITKDKLENSLHTVLQSNLH